VFSAEMNIFQTSVEADITEDASVKTNASSVCYYTRFSNLT